MAASISPPNRLRHRRERGPRIGRIDPGGSTASQVNVEYRLGKIRACGILQGTWLDYGCAVGGYTLALTQWGADRVIGIDVEPERLSKAQARVQESSAVRFLCVSSDTLPFDAETFDAVLLNEVLEHVADEGQTLR